MSVDISWSKSWSASDDGSVLWASDLQDIQSDVELHTHTENISVVGTPVANETVYYDGADWQLTAGFPSGGIIMWSGAISAIPTGWLICDGTNSTPNLTDRFVIHADADSGGTNDVGDTGGAHTHTHTVDSHTHAVDPPSTATGRDHSIADATGQQGEGNDDWGHLHTVDIASFTSGGSSGSTASESNIPKYYALAYIMKS